MSKWSGLTILSTLAIVFLLGTRNADAKRGCASFGHSCYGGMGKRAGEVMNPGDDILQDIQQEDNPEIVFTGPRSEYRNEQRQLTAQDIYNLSPFIRQWLKSIRSAQGLNTNEK